VTTGGTIVETACVVDTSVIVRLGDERIFHVIPQLFACAIVPQEVLDEIINHQALKRQISTYQQAAKVKIAGRIMLNQFQRASYDSAISSMRPYLSCEQGPYSNIGEMSAVALAIALSVPIVLMDDSDAEKVIARIPGIQDEIRIFRSVAVIRAAKACDIVSRRTERALEKKWASKGYAPMHSEDGEVLREALKKAGTT